MRVAFPLLAALAGLGLLAAAHAFLEPAAVPLRDLAPHEGARVSVEGWIAEVHRGARGAAFDLSDGASRARILFGGEPPASGAHVRVTGIVGREGEGYFVSAERIATLAPPRAEPVSAILAALEDGRPVSAQGIHVRGVLREGDDGLPLRFPEERAPEGPLRADGILRLDRARAGYALEVHAWTRG